MAFYSINIKVEISIVSDSSDGDLDGIAGKVAAGSRSLHLRVIQVISYY